MIYMQVTLSIIALLGAVCNGLILVSVIRYRILRKRHYSLLVSLAICDMFKVVVLVNIIISSGVVEAHRYCVLNSSLGMTLIFVTTVHLAAESVNRCLIVRAPYFYAGSITRRKLAAGLLGCWLLPAFFAIAVPAFWYEESWFSSLGFQEHMFGCSADAVWSSSDGYIIMIHVLFFAVPLLVMLVAYSIILHSAYTSARKLRVTQVRHDSPSSPAVTESTYSNPIIAMVSSSFDTTSVSGTGTSLPHIEHKTRSQSVASSAKRELQRMLKARKHELKASKTVLMIVFTFLACNAPIFCVTWLDLERADRQSELVIRKLLLGLAFAQVFIDPAVYFLRLKDYRYARKTIRHVGTTMIRKTIRRI